MRKILISSLVASFLMISSVAFAGKIVINSSASDPAPKAAWNAIIESFQKDTGIEAKVNLYDIESYKTSLRSWLGNQSPDIIFWYAGERMNTFVQRGLIEDVSDVWDANGLHDGMASSKSSITFDGKQYALPFTYYQWGIYYRKDIFAKYGLSVPKNWDELLNVCKVLKSNGITPFTIGTKYLWTTAGWFDYLNLRVNGLPTHLKLMSGDLSYESPEIRAVFAKWEELIRPGYFIDNHASYSWQEAQPFMYQGKAAMYLIGNFLVPAIPADQVDNMDFFPFPVINPDVPMYEEAPTDVIAIPKNAKNKEDARKFLAYVSKPENIRRLNDALRQLPTHKDSGTMDDKYLNKGNAMLASAKGLAQFYDRDTTPEMAKVGMKGFQEFMVKPDRLDRILKRIDKTRKRVFKKK